MHHITRNTYLIILVALIPFTLSCNRNADKQNTVDGTAARTNRPQDKIQKDIKEVTTSPPIEFETVQSWQIPAGGTGRVILIDRKHFNEADLSNLASILREKCRNDRYAYIFVFTDRKAALLRDKGAAGTATEAEYALMDKHYVAFYAKNSNTGVEDFQIFFDGPMGENTKTIRF
ncbi:MAG: hypothetical protein AB1690_03910 [Candidatus Zixiibacteriota bacterium]|jgi:hypothetical protein